MDSYRYLAIARRKLRKMQHESELDSAFLPDPETADGTCPACGHNDWWWCQRTEQRICKRCQEPPGPQTASKKKPAPRPAALTFAFPQMFG